MKITDLNKGDYHPYYASYIAKVGKELGLVEALELSGDEMLAFMQAIPLDRLEFRYAEGKWTIKEVLQHIIDTERIFAYRALRFARHDQTPLPGYEENDYVPVSQANRLTIRELMDDYRAVRICTLSLYRTFGEGVLPLRGVASGNAMSVRAIAFVIVGHERHHCEVIRKRYLNQQGPVQS